MKNNSIKKISAIVLFAAVATAAPSKEFFVYFGTYTNALSRGIYVARLDADTGKISAPELAAETVNPSYLAVSPSQRFIYAVKGVKMFEGRYGGAVAAFSVNQTNGSLNLLNEKFSGGEGPCHVSVDATGKILLVANYGGGSVYDGGSFDAYLLEANGGIGKRGGELTGGGKLGVNTNRQDSSHAHFISADPSNQFVLTCDLGTDEVDVFPIPQTAEIAGNLFYTFNVPPGSGPRHLAFGAKNKSIYVLNELTCSISRFIWGDADGDLKNVKRLKLQETVSALPPGVELQKNFTAAEILVHPSGQFVYATLRGHDSVSVFAANKKSGKLTFVQNISCGGKVPRGLGIDPTGHWLFTGNQKSDNVTEFSIEAKTGKLAATGAELRVGSPVDVKFVAAE